MNYYRTHPLKYWDNFNVELLTKIIEIKKEKK
jgi:hypothetical protein